MKCPDCDGKGYKEVSGNLGRGLHTLKLWCETCKGMGKVKLPASPREDIAWEGE